MMSHLSCFFLTIIMSASASNSSLKEVFRDDFTGDTLDSSKWNPTNTMSSVNSELQYYLPANVLLTNGTLALVSREEPHEEARYTSGRVDTRGKFSFTYGEVEWRARVPRGRGLWPALWLAEERCAPAVPCDFWPPAVSVIDVRGDQPDVVVTTLFYKLGGTQSAAQNNHMHEDMSLAFHVYKLLWTRTALVWLVDGKAVFWVVGEEKAPASRMQLVMNVAVGGGFPGPPDNTTRFPAQFLIDYVVVRQGDVDVSPWIPLLSATTAAPRIATADVQGPPVVSIVLGTLAGVLVLGVLVGAAAYLHHRKRVRLLHGDMRKGSSASTDSTLLSRSPYLAYLINSGYDKVDSAVQHYVNLLEVPMANVEIGAVLGSGEYGIVRKGVAKGLRGQALPTPVAIKGVKDKHSAEQNRQLIQEMKMMTKAGRHLNILNLLGAVFKGETLLLLEYSLYGCLIEFLKSHRGVFFYNRTDDTGQMVPLDEAAFQRQQQEAAAEAQRMPADEEFDGAILTMDELVSFAFQVSRGMAYLAGRNIIHRDLAARNVLVGEGRVLKIADFGMARQLSEYVLLNEHVALPVRWMPPEAISQRRFSQKSDVWSFGVLLWELFSLGATPYTDSAMDIGYVTEFLAALMRGAHMERPPACPAAVYEMMVRCWDVVPAERPVFSQLEQELSALVGRDSVETYLSLDTPYQQFNLAHQNLLDEIVEEAPDHVDGLQWESPA